MRSINIVNARQNNLKSVDIQIPRNKIVVFTGVSGSGKSSLVFETINAEAQRQLYDTLGTYAQSHLPKIPKPNCDLIENISPAILINQKRTSGNLRSTVGTTTEIYTYLRLLFSRIGTPLIGSSSHFSFNSPEGMCQSCNGSGEIMDIDIDKLIDKSRSLNEGAILFSEFKVGGWQWKYIALGGKFDCNLPVNQFSKAEYEKLLYGFDENIGINTGELGIDIIYEGVIIKINRLYIHKNQETLSKKKKQTIKQYLSIKSCDTCHGSRLNQEALGVKVNGYNIDQVSHFDFERLKMFIDGINDPHGKGIIEQIDYKVSHIVNIGLGYLSLSRNISTLSGGEAQRIKLAKQLGSSLTEMIYILDEPSVGLHPKDVHHLNNLLVTLRDKGNSVFVVEHDPDVIKIAEHIVDVGPKAGVNGGQIIFEGSYSKLLASDSITGKLLNRKNTLKNSIRKANSYFDVNNANTNNLCDVSVKIPQGIMTCITGVAGSGKSSLIHHEFLSRYPNAIVIDQSAVGQSERSNAATYTGLFDDIRKVYAKENNVKASLFSFNSEGACSGCRGLGFVEMEMAFLDPIRTLCNECKGKRYNEETLKYEYQGLNIAELLDLTIEKAARLFTLEKIVQKIAILQQVGLGYLTLGQPLALLSGGECQRVKLSSELHKVGNIYVLDEPTTGLHMSDANKIIDILNRLADKGNTVIIIEHNLDVMSQADWIIDVGPEGGENGGKIIFEGTPKALLARSDSHTATYLKKHLI